jgi:hypothetical protein
MTKREVIEVLKLIGIALLVAITLWVLLLSVLSLGGPSK